MALDNEQYLWPLPTLQNRSKQISTMRLYGYYVIIPEITFEIIFFKHG